MGAIKGGELCYGETERETFNGILKRYVGTQNFHNFTTRTKTEDPSARRYIVSFNEDDDVSIDGMEFVRCEVAGQSFMLHQIRKLIGLPVAVMRHWAPEALMETALKKDVNVKILTAPEVGLYLDECFFTSYNQKWKDSHEEGSMEVNKEEAEGFKMNYIYSHIASMEQKEGVVGLWLHSLNHCRGQWNLCRYELHSRSQNGNNSFNGNQCVSLDHSLSCNLHFSSLTSFSEGLTNNCSICNVYFCVYIWMLSPIS